MNQDKDHVFKNGSNLWNQVCPKYDKLGGVLGLIFAGYVPLASQSPFWANMYFRDPNLVTFYFYELTHFLDWMKNTLFFICSANILVRLVTVNMKKWLTPKKSENVRPHSSNSVENVTALQSIQSWKCDPIQRHIPISLLQGSTPNPPGEQTQRKQDYRIEYCYDLQTKFCDLGKLELVSPLLPLKTQLAWNSNYLCQHQTRKWLVIMCRWL